MHQVFFYLYIKIKIERLFFETSGLQIEGRCLFLVEDVDELERRFPFSFYKAQKC